MTKNVIDCDPWGPAEAEAVVCKGQLASICSVDNLTQYTLTPPRRGHLQYALIVVSNVALQGETPTFTVDQVEPVGASAVHDVSKMLRKLGVLAQQKPTGRDVSARASTPQWLSPEKTPWTARKARRLEATPTDTSLPDGTSSAAHSPA